MKTRSRGSLNSEQEHIFEWNDRKALHDSLSFAKNSVDSSLGGNGLAIVSLRFWVLWYNQTDYTIDLKRQAHRVIDVG
jgi:hypothetical protein